MQFKETGFDHASHAVQPALSSQWPKLLRVAILAVLVGFATGALAMSSSETADSVASGGGARPCSVASK